MDLDGLAIDPKAMSTFKEIRNTQLWLNDTIGILTQLRCYIPQTLFPTRLAPREVSTSSGEPTRPALPQDEYFASFEQTGTGHLSPRRAPPPEVGRSHDLRATQLVLPQTELGLSSGTVTLLLVDITDFSAVVRTQPEQVEEIISTYLAAVHCAVNASGGIVDKVVGDKVLSHWNA
eukprot:RCo041123